MKSKKHKLNLVLSLFLINIGLYGCGGGGSNQSSNSINTQPTNSNWTNYFSNYSINNQDNNLIIYQIQHESGIPVKLSIYNSFGYTSSSNNPIQSFDLIKNLNTSNTYNVLVKNSANIPSVIGYVSEVNSNNSLVVLLNLTSILKNELNKETSTIQLAAKNMLQNVELGQYYSHCFNLPLMNNQTKVNNDGNDLCMLNLQSNGDFSITDINRQVSMCNNGSNWYQNPLNPYLYKINCITDNGQLSFNISAQNYGTSQILNFYVNSKYTGNNETTYVATAFKQSDLSNVESETVFNYTNLYMSNSYIAGSSLISENSIVNNYCMNNSSTSFCLLSKLMDNVNGVNRIIPTSGTITSYPLLIGSENLNLFTDNLGYTYYTK